MRTSEVKNGLNSKCIAVLKSDGLFGMFMNNVVGFVHINTVGYDLVGPSSAENVLHICKTGNRRQ